MTAAVILLIALISMSAMLAAALLVAWYHFARPRHAAIWAASHGLAALSWSTALLFVLLEPDSLFYQAVINGLTMISFALLLIGFRQRAGRPPLAGPLLEAGLLATLLIIFAIYGFPHAGVRQAVAPLFGAILSALSIPLVVRDERAGNLPERVLMGLLVMFAVLLLGAAGLALMQGAAGDDYYLIMYRVVALIIMPFSFGGIGLFILLLLGADAASDLRRLTAIDPLTGALNRRGFEDAAIRAIANARRQGQPLSIVLADIDRFKQINDGFGHATGDIALRRFADEIVLAIRAGDVLARIGGEEFALLLVNTGEENAIDVVDRIRQGVAAMAIEAGLIDEGVADAGEAVRLTASFGVTALEPQDVTPADILERADRALYQSKLGGRDQVTLLRGGSPLNSAAELS